ncbi:MAG: hypothetical protein AABY62_07870 [Pseudomonadota bacterium]
MEPTRRILDEEHLRLLALFHYISGGLTILFSCVFIIHLTFLGLLMSSPNLLGPVPSQGPDPQSVLSVIFTIFAVLIALGIGYGIAQIISGRFLARRRHRTFSLIVAIPNLLLIPYGTLLGVFTLMVLGRESVKNLYTEKT